MPRKLASSERGVPRYKRFGLRNAAGDGFTEIQFEKPPSKVPYKAIFLAVGLFLMGSILIVIGALLLTGYINAKYSDRTWPVLILGAIMFIPGVYHVRIAYYAYKGYDGFSYDDIPEFDD